MSCQSIPHISPKNISQSCIFKEGYGAKTRKERQGRKLRKKADRIRIPNPETPKIPKPPETEYSKKAAFLVSCVWKLFILKLRSVRSFISRSPHLFSLLYLSFLVWCIAYFTPSLLVFSPLPSSSQSQDKKGRISTSCFRSSNPAAYPNARQKVFAFEPTHRILAPARF